MPVGLGPQNNKRVASPFPAGFAGSGIFGPVSQTPAGRVVANGVISGTSDALRGGKFQSGFAAGAFSGLAAPLSGKIGGFGGAIASAVISGTASVVGGGKFANGAARGAFAYLVSSVGARQPGNASGGGLVNGELDVVGKIWRFRTPLLV